MATKLQSFPVRKRTDRFAPFRRYLDGGIYELKYREDFACRPATLRCYLYQAGRALDLHVRIAAKGFTSLIVQASRTRRTFGA